MVAQAFGAVGVDETAEDIGVVGVADVAIRVELDDSDAVEIAEDVESDSTGVVLEPVVTSELWKETALEIAWDEMGGIMLMEDEASAPWSQTLTYVLTQLVDVRKVLAVAL